MPAADPLASWRFAGTLRHYQADVLDRVDVDAGEPLHIVAPPGSGKTLLGLLLAARRGRRTLVLAPTVTIRAQWARSAEALASDAGQISEDPRGPGDLTVLTYQSLSVLDGENPLAALAATRWRDEVEADGRSPEAAHAWLTDLEESNPAAYRSGIARRSRTLRRQLVRENPDVLAAVLHPNARALVDRLVSHGVETIVLDECHHLLDHWALVVAALVTRLRADGRAPLVIGLTATLPSPDDANEYDNYTSLLGDVDYEVPAPAVVREGNLAPYRDLVQFVEPTAEELAFLAAHATGLAVLIRTTFARDAGLDFVIDALQPHPPSQEPASVLAPPAPDDGMTDADRRLAAAFAADFARAEAAAAMLATVAPQHPLVALLPDVARRPPTSDEALRLLGRFALDRVLHDPGLSDQWDRIRRTLGDFGFALSDRGVRRTRDPVDTLLASSLAKDHAVCDILRLERGAIGDERLRALVVTDFAEHGNRQGGLVGSAGALRTFDVVVADAATRRLRAVLVTGGTTRIAAHDAVALVPAFRALLGLDVEALPVDGTHAVVELRTPGASSAAMVRAVSELLTRGDVHVVVGTRGLFGEGWDCPAVNTLIDLTAVATASATQQLRGRTLRLDPAWPGKVAHNWTVTAVLPSSFPLGAAPDVARLRRKHARLWGLDLEDPGLIVRGVGTVLSPSRASALHAVVAKRPGASVGALEAAPPPRADTYAAWRIGTEYVDREGVIALVSRRTTSSAFRTSRPAAAALGGSAIGVGAGAAVGTALVSALDPVAGVVGGVALAAASVWAGAPLVRAWWRARARSTRVPETYARVGAVVWAGLARSGRVNALASRVVVTESAPVGGSVTVSIACPDEPPAHQRALADALSELFAPVRTPRYLLELDRGGRSWIVRSVLRRTRDGDGQLLAVPTAIGRRRADAEAFAADWERELGACTLHPLDTPDALLLVARARRTGDGGAAAPTTRDTWI